MSLLVNQLSLSLAQLKTDRKTQALERLQATQLCYPQTNIIKNNKSVLAHQIQPKVTQLSKQQKQKLIDQFKKVIENDPLNYVGYYNLFNIHIRFGNKIQAMNSITQCISALNLSVGLRQKSQKKVNQGIKYCQKSISARLIKAITHINNQKYVMALHDLDWILNEYQLVRYGFDLKRQIMTVKRIIYECLGQKAKVSQVDQYLNKLTGQITQKVQSQSFKMDYQILVRTQPMPADQQKIMEAIKHKMYQFVQLLIQSKEVKSFKTNSNLQSIVLKQFNQNDLNSTKLTITTLIEKLSHSIYQSELYINKKRQSDQVNRSQGLSNNASQDLIYNPQSGNFPKIIDTKKQSNKKQNKNISASNHVINDSMHNSVDYDEAKKLNMSLNTSGIKGKKKTQNIYPLERQRQYVEIKLVMAQLTNNKQIMGKMDPYCLITYNGQKKKSSVIKSGGLEPRWNESFKFQLTENPSLIKIEVYDEQKYIKTDDFVGQGQQLLEKNGFIKMQIYQKKKSAGTVFISIKSLN